MDISNIQLAIPLGGLASLVGIWLTMQKILRNVRKEREEYALKILQNAKEADFAIKEKLEAKIEKVHAELKNLELNINKDLAHVKEAHSTDLRNLADKIEALRDELRQQSAGTLELLTKIIDKE